MSIKVEQLIYVMMFFYLRKNYTPIIVTGKKLYIVNDRTHPFPDAAGNTDTYLVVDQQQQ